MRLSPLFWRLLFAAAMVVVAMFNRVQAAECGCTALAAVQPASWIFQPGRYTHDLETGNRVAQYLPKPAIEPLPDQRLVTSGYSRSRTVLRGADGSSSTYYRVENYGNGRGGLDAEWERFHDAWRGATIAGGQYQFGYQPFGYGGFGGYPGQYGPGQFGQPGFPGNYPPGFGQPGFGQPGFGRGPGFVPPDYRRLDPDAADGYPERRRRTPDRAFFGRDRTEKETP